MSARPVRSPAAGVTRSTGSTLPSWLPRRGSGAFPSVGPAIPGAGLAALAAVVGSGLAWLVLPPQPAVLAAVVSVLAAVFPRALLTWVLMVVVAVAVLAGGVPGAGDLRFHLVLAGIPLLHLLTVWSSEVPPRTRVQLRVLARPGLRYLGVQVVCQVVATAALWAFAPGRSSFGPMVVLALAATVATAFVVVRALRGTGVEG